jgi:hypothetical protein
VSWSIWLAGSGCGFRRGSRIVRRAARRRSPGSDTRRRSSTSAPWSAPALMVGQVRLVELGPKHCDVSCGPFRITQARLQCWKATVDLSTPPGGSFPRVPGSALMANCSGAAGRECHPSNRGRSGTADLSLPTSSKRSCATSSSGLLQT